MIGVLFATEEEAQPFLSRFRRGRFDGLTDGETYHDDEVLISICGTGKIKATLRTERLLRQYKLRHLLHVGTCTALGDDVPIGQLVAAAQVFEGDRIELASPTYPRMPLATPFSELQSGTLVTQDHTVRDASERTYWQRIADYTDMTGYAVAFVTATYGTPCHIVKVVSGRLLVDDPNLRKTLATAYDTLATFLVKRLDVLIKA